MPDEKPFDMTDLVTDLVNDAELGDESTINEETEVIDDTPADPVADPEKPADPAKPDEKTPPVVDPDEIKITDEELIALGLKPPKPGERENKIPHSRVVKMVGKAIQNWRAKNHLPALTERDGKLSKAETELKRFRDLDALATGEPEKYVRTLGALFPDKYSRFVDYLDGKVAAAGTGDKKVPDAANDPEPAPTGKFPDGTTGYTAEEFAAHQAWTRRQAVRDAGEAAAALIAKELKPYKDREQVQADAQKRIDWARNQIADAQETWGEDYPKAGTPEETQLGEFLKAHPDLSFKAGVREWVRPRITKDRNTIRAEVLAEQDARGKKQERTPPAQAKVVVDNENKSTEDIVREAVQAAGLFK